MAFQSTKKLFTAISLCKSTDTHTHTLGYLNTWCVRDGSWSQMCPSGLHYECVHVCLSACTHRDV